jgi:hypothetical protein
VAGHAWVRTFTVTYERNVASDPVALEVGAATQHRRVKNIAFKKVPIALEAGQPESTTFPKCPNLYGS